MINYNHPTLREKGWFILVHKKLWVLMLIHQVDFSSGDYTSTLLCAAAFNFLHALHPLKLFPVGLAVPGGLVMGSAPIFCLFYFILVSFRYYHVS